MMSYDPETPPQPDQWLALDEQVRIRQAEDYHRKARIKLPNAKAHAAFHAIVENQVALGLPSVLRAMARLRGQGLSRHDAIHAVCTVLAQHFFEVMSAKDGALGDAAQARYDADLDALDGQRWRRDYG